MRVQIVFAMLLISLQATAQDDWADKFVKDLGSSGAKKRAKLDSIDFHSPTW